MSSYQHHCRLSLCRSGLVVALILSLPAVEMPAYGDWRQSHIGGGGYLVDGVQCPSAPDRWYWWSDVSGVWRSDDNAHSWRMVSDHTEGSLLAVRGLVVHPQRADDLVIAVGTQWRETQGVYRSRDGGRTWSRTLSAQFYGNEGLRADGNVLARDPHRPERLWAASSGDGLYRSDDGGDTWTLLGLPGIDVSALVCDPHHAGRLIVCAQPTTCWYQRDGRSQQWELTGGLFHSADSGDTWERTADLAPREIHPHPHQTDIWYGIAGAHARLVRSNDRGRTWTDWSQGLDLEPDDRKPASDLKRSYAALAVLDEAVVVASGNSTVWRRAHDANQWTAVPVTDVDAGEWYGLRPGSYRRFARATAGLRVDIRDSTRWLLSDWYAIWESRDAGSTWRWASNGIENTVIHTLHQDPSDPGRVHMGMADNGYFRSADGGASFRMFDNRGPQNAKAVVVSSDPLRVYALGPATHDWYSNQVFVSIDAGTTWTRSPQHGLGTLGEARINSITVDPRDPLRVWITRSGTVEPDGGGVWRSEDGGASWCWQGAGLPAEGLFAASIWAMRQELACDPAGDLVALSQSARRLWRWNDDTSQWEETRRLSGEPRQVAADTHRPGRFFAAVRGEGLLRSDDSGRTWAVVVADGADAVAVDIAVADRVAAARSQERGVVISTDGGDTWQDLDSALPNRTGLVLAFAGDRLVAGTAGNGVFWLPVTGEGRTPVRAQTLAIAASAGVPLVLRNADLEEDDPSCPGWDVRWFGTGGRAAVVRDTQTAAVGTASLRLDGLDAGSHAVVGRALPVSDGVLVVEGYMRATGGRLTQVAIQSFDADNEQVGWIPLVQGGTAIWQPFSARWTPPRGAVRHHLVLAIEGAGSLGLDGLAVRSIAGVFPAREAVGDGKSP